MSEQETAPEPTGSRRVRRYRIAILLVVAVLLGGGAAAGITKRRSGPADERSARQAGANAPEANAAGGRPSSALTPRQGRFPQSFPGAPPAETLREWSTHGTVANGQEGRFRIHTVDYVDPTNGRKVHRFLEVNPDGAGAPRQLTCTVSGTKGYDTAVLQQLDTCIGSVLRGGEAATVIGWLNNHAESKPALHAYVRKTFPSLTVATRIDKDSVRFELMPKLPSHPK